MSLPRRSSYYKPNSTPSDEALMDRIGDICVELSGYGYRRVTEQFHRDGWIVNHNKVDRIIGEKAWSCRPQKQKRIPCYIEDMYNQNECIPLLATGLLGSLRLW